MESILVTAQAILMAVLNKINPHFHRNQNHQICYMTAILKNLHTNTDIGYNHSSHKISELVN
jgi:hypothetical protein